ncbi:Uncharacterised protein [Kluyvera cryocrescens]|uniref:Uncharacterized protein n=1 Tax=Kluyvera cryocrescens TaxID=580 RepID=A0A485C877_KLUCR|nr:Uncharacterised protein [Kluyvera cryocrescens]
MEITFLVYHRSAKGKQFNLSNAFVTYQTHLQLCPAAPVMTQGAYLPKPLLGECRSIISTVIYDWCPRVSAIRTSVFAVG